MQCNCKTLRNVKCSKCPPFAITRALRLNTTDQSLDQWSSVCQRCLRLSTSRTGCWQTHSCSIADIL